MTLYFDDDAMMTDPPYFDNVHYSELADFFYVWMKLASVGADQATTRRDRL
jgi:putative DNA methylase